MKKLIIILVVLASIYSCTKETDDMASNMEYNGQWELVKMTGSLEGSEYTGLDMDWQETYIINEDETFTKTRVRGDSTIVVSGTYTYTEEGLLEESELDLITYIKFSHNTDNAIIGSCGFQSLTEYLYFNSNNKLISTWNACDGPGLEYIKK
jgi:hypothetical protein